MQFVESYSPLTGKLMAPLDCWGDSASETCLRFQENTFGKFDFFDLFDLTLNRFSHFFSFKLTAPCWASGFSTTCWGGGGCLNTPPSISVSAHRRTKRETAFKSSRKIILKSFRSFFCSGQNWGHQGSKFQNFPKRFLDDKIFNFKGKATILIPSCLSSQGASNHV